MAQTHRWPTFNADHQRYIRDKHGVIWFADTQFGDGVVTAVTSAGSITVALRVLRDLRGPLHDLSALNDDIIREFPTIDPQPKLNEAVQDVLARTEDDYKALQS